MSGKNTCKTCAHAFAPPEQPGGLYCQLEPPQYGGHLTNFIDGQQMAQTIFVDPPVNPARQGCTFYTPGAGKKK